MPVTTKHKLYLVLLLFLLLPIVLGAYVASFGRPLTIECYVVVVDGTGRIVMDDVDLIIDPTPDEVLFAPPNREGERYCNIVYEGDRKRKLNLADVCVSFGSSVSSEKVFLYLGDGRWMTSARVVRPQHGGSGGTYRKSEVKAEDGREGSSSSKNDL